MKDIVNKKGFSLTEIVVVISLISILLLFTMPSLIKIFSNNFSSAMEIQENELKEAGLLYLEDYCKNPLGSRVCPSTILKGANNKYSGYIKLSELVNDDYIEEISIQGVNCNGCVIFENNKATSYLICEDEYSTKSDIDYKTKCNLNWGEYMKKKGQALVEFIIILPVLIMLFFGAIDFGRIILRKNELESISSDLTELYKEGKSFNELEKFLKENNENNTLVVKNKDNKYIELTLESTIEFITPGLGKILGKDYKITTKRVIYYE